MQTRRKGKNLAIHSQLWRKYDHLVTSLKIALVLNFHGGRDVTKQRNGTDPPQKKKKKKENYVF